MPPDPSEITGIECDLEGSDGHSHSYLTASEITELCNRMAEIKYPHENETPDLEYRFVGYLGGNSWANFERGSASQPDQYEDVRFVFWFDN